MDIRKERIFRAVIFVVTVLWFGSFAVMRIDLHHDAIMLKPAIDVAAGRVIFRDTFCQYGALAVWLQALAVKLFGGELIVIQLLTVFFYGGICVLIDRIFRRFLSFPFRLMNLALFWGMAPFYIVPFHPWSSVYALFFMLLSTEFMLDFIETEHRRDVFCAGLFIACAFLARHPCGAVSFAAGLATLVLSGIYLKVRRSSIRDYSLGSVAVLVPFVLYISLAGAWEAYVRQCFGFVGRFAFARGGSGSWSELVSRLFPISDGFGPLDLIYSLLPLCCLAVVLKALSEMSRNGSADGRSRSMVKYLAVALAGLASWHQYYPVPCVRHLYWAAIPMFGIYALCCEYLWRRTSRRVLCRAAAVVLFVTAVPPIGFRMLYGVVSLVGGSRRTVDLPGVRHLRLSQSEWMLLESFGRVYADLPPQLRSRGVFNCTKDAAFSVIFPETTFRHPMFVDWGDEVYDDYPAAAQRYIREHRPPLVSSKELFIPGYAPVCRGGLYGVQYWFYAPLY